jgi:hypothetical protein
MTLAPVQIIPSLIAVPEVSATVIAAGGFGFVTPTVAIAVVVSIPASVTETVYVPAVKPEMV